MFFVITFEVYFINSSKMTENFPEVLKPVISQTRPVHLLLVVGSLRSLAHRIWLHLQLVRHTNQSVHDCLINWTAPAVHYFLEYQEWAIYVACQVRCKHCKRVLTRISSLSSSYKIQSLVHSSKWRPTLSATPLCFSIHAYSNLCILFGLCSWAYWICLINSFNRCGCLIVIATGHPLSFCQLCSFTNVNSTR